VGGRSRSAVPASHTSPGSHLLTRCCPTLLTTAPCPSASAHAIGDEVRCDGGAQARCAAATGAAGSRDWGCGRPTAFVERRQRARHCRIREHPTNQPRGSPKSRIRFTEIRVRGELAAQPRGARSGDRAPRASTAVDGDPRCPS
jgi:hypothetical protein